MCHRLSIKTSIKVVLLSKSSVITFLRRQWLPKGVCQPPQIVNAFMAAVQILFYGVPSRPGSQRVRSYNERKALIMPVFVSGFKSVLKYQL